MVRIKKVGQTKEPEELISTKEIVSFFHKLTSI
jgi:hypothetical protein